MPEQVHIVLGEIPYRAQVVDAMGGGIEVVVVLEDIGSPDDELPGCDAQTAYVPQGTMILCEWHGGERHVTTGRRMLRVSAEP